MCGNLGFQLLEITPLGRILQFRKFHSDIFPTLADKPIEVVLKIDASIASHFTDTPILPEQQLLKQLDDGSLLVTSTIKGKKQIIPILKYWLPDIEILSPSELKQSLVYELQFSIDQLSS